MTSADGPADRRPARQVLSPSCGAEWRPLVHAEDIGLAAADFEGPRFVRVEKVRALMASGQLDDDLRMQVEVT